MPGPARRGAGRPAAAGWPQRRACLRRVGIPALLLALSLATGEAAGASGTPLSSASAVFPARAGLPARPAVAPLPAPAVTAPAGAGGTRARPSGASYPGRTSSAVAAAPVRRPGPSTSTTVPLISTGPSLSPAGVLGPAGGAEPGRTSTSTAPRAVLPAGAGALLTSITYEERQMASLDAYVEARAYLGRAVALEAVADRRYLLAMAVWKAKTAIERHDVLVQARALAKVVLYRDALYELGLAEYTGESAPAGTSLEAQERQVEVLQLGDMAASDTIAGLRVARSALALARARTARAEVAVARAWAVSRARRQRLQGAQAQVALSRHDLDLARTWATVAGQAPTGPVEALAAREGGLRPHRPPKHRVVVVRGDLSSGASSFAVFPEGPPPVPELSPAVVPAGIGALVPAVTTTTAGAAPTTVPPAGPGTAAGPLRPAVVLSAPAQRVRAVLGALAGQGPTVLGPSVLTAAQIEGWFASTGARATVSVPMVQLVTDYLKASLATGVRGDVAFAQAVVETGYFSFPVHGQDPASYNNFAGIGACDHCKHGWRFPSAMAGVLSQQLLLSAYATPVPVVGSRAPVGVQGCCRTWMALSGVWASNPAYGYTVLTVYNEMLAYALRTELARVGLATVEPAATG